jgi:putative pyruvate formate lyase activating enzyme
MPDLKYWSPDRSGRYFRAPDYPEVARAAVAEMHRQVGDLVCGADGLARRGLLVRHLIMPDGLDDTRAIAGFLAGLSRDTYVNLMAQYHPAGRVGGSEYPELDRRPAPAEVRAAHQVAAAAGLYRFDRRT